MRVIKSVIWQALNKQIKINFLLGMLGSSAPVNIPGSALSERNTLGSNFSPSTSSPLQLQSGFLSAARFSHQDSLDSVRTSGPLVAINFVLLATLVLYYNHCIDMVEYVWIFYFFDV